MALNGWLIAVLAAMVWPAPGVLAQAPDEEAAILAVLDRYMTAISEKDLETMASLQTPEGMTYRARALGGGGWDVAARPNSSWVDPANTDDFTHRERYWSPTVLVRGGIAVVWAPYEFWLDGKTSHCGINVFNFVKIDGAWLVSNSMWTVEAGGCAELRPRDPSSIRPAARGPARVVDGRVLTSSDLPALRIRVDSGFTFAGVVPFRIRDMAEGERFLFVDSKDGDVRRMVIAQFEKIQPASSETYRYSFDGAEVIAGFRFRQNAFAFSHREAAAENPSGEAALTAEFLRRNGYRLHDEVMSVRRLTVPDSARRHELIVFYIEPLPPAGARLADLYAGDEETPLWQELSAKLRARAAAAFEILPPAR